jgi:hypothetical protein
MGHGMLSQCNGKSSETAEIQKTSIDIANPSKGGYLVAVGFSFGRRISAHPLLGWPHETF